jgi:hypothetical protein
MRSCSFQLQGALQMRTRARVGYVLGIGVATALLTACGGSSVPAGVRDGNAAVDTGGTKTFEYTGKKQTFTVPMGVTQLTVDARGAAGGVGTYISRVPSARGGRIYATIPVQPGEKLYVFVGGRSSGGNGGFNGGGSAGQLTDGHFGGFGGGGGSDVRAGGDTMHDRILVAAGGGGQGGAVTYSYGPGGPGGGLRGRDGGPHVSGCTNSGAGGDGGRQRKGGSGGSGGEGVNSGANGQPGAAGALGVGGSGGNGGQETPSQVDAGGGGGGGGYYGGGGGGGAAGDYAKGCGSFYAGFGGGGGGGSSYIEPAAIERHTSPGKLHARVDGIVIFSWQ